MGALIVFFVSRIAIAKAKSNQMHDAIKSTNACVEATKTVQMAGSVTRTRAVSHAFTTKIAASHQEQSVSTTSANIANLEPKSGALLVLLRVAEQVSQPAKKDMCGGPVKLGEQDALMASTATTSNVYALLASMSVTNDVSL